MLYRISAVRNASVANNPRIPRYVDATNVILSSRQSSSQKNRRLCLSTASPTYEPQIRLNSRHSVWSSTLSPCCTTLSRIKSNRLRSAAIPAPCRRLYSYASSIVFHTKLAVCVAFRLSRGCPVREITAGESVNPCTCVLLAWASVLIGLFSAPWIQFAPLFG